jgi:hypothetical protein
MEERPHGTLRPRVAAAVGAHVCAAMRGARRRRNADGHRPRLLRGGCSTDASSSRLAPPSRRNHGPTLPSMWAPPARAGWRGSASRAASYRTCWIDARARAGPPSKSADGGRNSALA